MISFGLNLTQVNDPLHKMELEILLSKIKNPKAEFLARIDQLRRIKDMNENQYKQLKVGLPYFCCSLFNPPYRKKENFSSISLFTLDFDNFSDSLLNKEQVFELLKEDSNVRFLFTSPSGDGLKALFVLEEACKDAGKYVHFYKSFSQTFARKYNLETVIDWVTHDVTRATFMSADLRAWDNPSAEKVNVENYVSADLGHEFSKVEKEFNDLVKENKSSFKTPVKQSGLNQETLVQIKERLNPSYKPRKKKEIHIPDELAEAMPLIEKALSEENVKLVKIESIHYGKQIKISLGHYWAELNVFYGKKGFTVVKTTKSGSHKELGELGFQILDRIL